MKNGYNTMNGLFPKSKDTYPLFCVRVSFLFFPFTTQHIKHETKKEKKGEKVKIIILDSYY